LHVKRGGLADGKAREGFDIDLSFGGIREGAFANVLFKATVEHKSDQVCRRTGNVFIEYEYSGRPSGIAVSTAQFYAIEFDDDCWVVVPTERLKVLCRRLVQADRLRLKAGGDNNQCRGVLLKLSELIAI
jgi:hypothetical protein